MSKNGNLMAAKKAKNDEFYTRYEDIQAEMDHYNKHFEGKTVLCNCDDPYESNFCKFFLMNFNRLKLKRLICTSYSPSKMTAEQLTMFGSQPTAFAHEKAYLLDVTHVPMKDGHDISQEDVEELLHSKDCGITELKGNGDFRSEEYIEYLKQADIVVSNPPFSLAREFIAQLIEYGKKFLIINNMNSITYKEVFPLFKDNKMWIGYTSPKKFIRPDGTVKSFGNILWYTNLDIDKRHEKLMLSRQYHGHEEDYPQYDNYDAINVDKVTDIPIDFDGVMGVPITFLNKYCPEQFEIVTFRKGDNGEDLVFAREKEREFNLTFTSLFDSSVEPDYRCNPDDLQQRKEQAYSGNDMTEDMKSFAEYICSHPELIKVALAEGEPVEAFFGFDTDGIHKMLLNGKEPFKRILVRRRRHHAATTGKRGAN